MVEGDLLKRTVEGIWEIYIDGKLVGFSRNQRDAEEIYDNHLLRRQKLKTEEKERNRKMADATKDSPKEDPAEKGEKEASAIGKGLMYYGGLARERVSSGGFWIKAVIFILIIWFIYEYVPSFKERFPIQGFLTNTVTLAGLITVLVIVGFILYGLGTFFKYHDFTRLFVALALMIWLLDLFPYGNIPPYTGFDFPFTQIDRTFQITLFSIITSSIYMGLLYFNMLLDIVKKQYVAIGLGFLAIIGINRLAANYFPDSLRFAFNIPNWVYWLIAIGLIILVFVIYHSYKKHGASHEIPNFLSVMFSYLIFSFFMLNRGWMLNFRAVAHFLFILAFGYGYIHNEEKNNKVFANILTPILLIVDFFGYGVLYNSDILWLKFIPVAVLFSISYCYKKHENDEQATYPVMAFALVVTFILILSLQAAAYEGNPIPFVQREGDPFLKNVWNLFGTKVTELVTGQLDVATGGYYKTQVEKNRFQPLGAYVDKVKASQPRYFSDEPVTIWGTVKSKTFSDPVTVSFTCYRLVEDRKQPMKVATTPEEAKSPGYDKVIPDKPFTVYDYEDKDVECTFAYDRLQPRLSAGTNNIVFSATYNFFTNAYQKVYFIDREKLRAMTKEGIDPFKEFGIVDRNPATFYTNGPVELGIEMQRLIPVTDSAELGPNVGIRLVNRGKITDEKGQPVGQWQGNLNKIKEITILLPKGLTINPEECRPAKFEDYDLGKCKVSCKDIVFDDCVKGCSGVSCNRDCEMAKANCETDCDNVFKDDENQISYKGYRLLISEIKDNMEYRDLNKDRNKIFGCRLIFSDPKSILDNSPLTTRYIRMRARYDYTVEKTVAVTVEQNPTKLDQTVDETLKSVLGEKNYGDGRIPLTSDFTMSVAELKALMYVESKMRHCCLESGKNRWNTCVPTNEVKCPTDRVITSFDGSSKGIMQINTINAGLTSKVCKNGQTLEDRECNIEVGKKILSNNYLKWGANGIPATTLQKYCPNDQDHVSYYTKYLSYRKLEAALRAYNGWGCKMESKCADACRSSNDKDACTNNCISGTVNYVDKILKEVLPKIRSDSIYVPTIQEIEEIPKNLEDQYAP